MWSLGCCQFRSLAWLCRPVFCCGSSQPRPSRETGQLPTVRVGTLKFGTVNWELDVMARHGLDRAHGFTLKTVDFAGKDGADIALQGGAVDIILTDWLWVAKRRAMGGDFTFAPHSPCHRRADGAERFRHQEHRRPQGQEARHRRRARGQELDHPSRLRTKGGGLRSGDRRRRRCSRRRPCSIETLKRGDIPAALNFWQYNARLDGAHFTELIKVEDMLPAVGLPADMPLLGWVFSERWAKAHPDRATRLSRRRRRGAPDPRELAGGMAGDPRHDRRRQTTPRSKSCAPPTRAASSPRSSRRRPI